MDFNIGYNPQNAIQTVFLTGKLIWQLQLTVFKPEINILLCASLK